MAQADLIESRSLSFDAALQELGAVLHGIAVLQLAPAAAARDDPDFARLEALARRFSPEELQLYYQIALQGRGDLGSAPDEYAGFTMTLLRMLAFVPGEVDGERPRADGSNTVTANCVPAPQAAKPEEPPLAVSPPDAMSKPSAEVSIEDWPAFVKSLRIGGMAGMLAQNCELASCADGRIELRVPEAHKHLMEKAYQEKLRSVLQERLVRRSGVLRSRSARLAAGPLRSSTPANRQARQSQAIAAIEGDPFVRELVEDLGGRVVPESIRPLS